MCVTVEREVVLLEHLDDAALMSARCVATLPERALCVGRLCVGWRCVWCCTAGR